MLQTLLEYARREQLVVTPGLKPKTVRWLLLFSLQGQFLNVHDYGQDRRGKGREFPACPDLTQQEMVAIGSGCRHFLVDSLDVVCLLTKEEEVDEKLAAKHAFFVGLLEQASECLSTLAPIAAALRDESTLASIRAKLAEGKAKPTDSATLAVVSASGDATVFVEQETWHKWWQACRNRMVTDRKVKNPPRGRKAPDSEPEQSQRMLCLLSGDLVKPQPTHNKIEGLSDVGGLSMGDTLTSFDKEAFSSFGLSQGANAAMSETMVKTYVTALNHLIRNRSHRMAGVKVIHWYSGPIHHDDDPMRELLEGFGIVSSEEEADPDEQEKTPQPNRSRQQYQAEGCARRLLEAIQSGQRPELGDFRYYALTLSANSGRVVVRDWMEGRFEDLLTAVNAWFDDLAIINRDGRYVIPSQKFLALLAAPLRDLKDAPAPLATTLWHCALKRQPIPFQVMAQTLQRVRNDLVTGETLLHARFALLKAFCNRNERTPNMAPELNDCETHPAYLAGRIMAILARIQQVVMPDVSAGIVQRYYAAASSTPALVLGRLIRTAQIAHLPKIESKGLQIWFQNQLTEVWSKLQVPLPTTLTLEEQTLFAMGYYHQNARRSASVTAEQPAETVNETP